MIMEKQDEIIEEEGETIKEQGETIREQDKTIKELKQKVGSIGKNEKPAAPVSREKIIPTNSSESLEFNSGLLLFLVALIVFIIGRFTDFSNVYVLLAPLFLIYAGIFVFKGKAALIVIIFSVWYFLLGAADLSQVIYYIIPITVIGALIHGLVNMAMKKESFTETAGGELGIGLMLIAIFFLDAGLLDLLSKKIGFSLPIIFSQLLSWIPLWAYVGLYAMIRDEGKGPIGKTGIGGKLLTFIKFAAIIYLVLIIIAIPAGMAGEVGKGGSLLPGTEELVKARQEAERALPKTENPAYSNLICLLNEPTNVPACVQNRQSDSKRRTKCTASGLEDGTTAFEKCLQQEIEEEKKIAVAGATDVSIKIPMRAEFIEGQFFPRELSRGAREEFKFNYPLEFKIDNPRGEPFVVEFKCNFTPKLTQQIGVQGDIIGLRDWSIKPGQEKVSITMICQPVEPLNGSYTLTYEAQLRGLKTKSRLQRAFLAPKLPEKKKEQLINDILNINFPTSASSLSQGPDDFARINFAFGNPLENPIVEPEKGGLLLASSVENLGNGQIMAIKNFKIHLEDFGVEPLCIGGENVPVPSLRNYYKEIIHLPNCLINNLPEIYTAVEEAEGEYILNEFEAELEYDYLLKKEIDVIVRVIS